MLSLHPTCTLQSAVCLLLPSSSQPSRKQPNLVGRRHPSGCHLTAGSHHQRGGRSCTGGRSSSLFSQTSANCTLNALLACTPLTQSLCTLIPRSALTPETVITCTGTCGHQVIDVISRADMPTLPQGLVSYNAPTQSMALQAAPLNLPNIVAIAFSPKNTYLTTFQRPQPGAGNAEKNLKVTHARSHMFGRYLLRCHRTLSSAHCA